jgi:hypothetical protein
MIIVFLKDKLISCDTILPVILEIQQYKKHPVLFIVPKKSTYDVIKNNVVLFDAISTLGTLSFIGSGGKLTNKVAVLMKLLLISLQCKIQKGVIIHFGSLNRGLIKKIFLINAKRTIFSEADNFGSTALMLQVRIIGGGKKVQLKKNEDFLGKYLLKLSKHLNLEEYNVENKQVFHFGGTRSRPVWVNYINHNADRYLSNLFSQWNISITPSIVIILSYFGPIATVKDGQTMERLFKETLEFLVKAANGVPILIKPHAITDINIVQQEVQKYPKTKIAITHLHPSVLAKTAIFFISNLHSTTFGDAHLWNVPTIEYASYKEEVLEVTNNGSNRPDMTSYFVHEDFSQLQKTVYSLLEDYKPTTQNTALEVKKNDSFFQLFQ